VTRTAQIELPRPARHPPEVTRSVTPCPWRESPEVTDPVTPSDADGPPAGVTDSVIPSKWHALSPRTSGIPPGATTPRSAQRDCVNVTSRKPPQRHTKRTRKAERPIPALPTYADDIPRRRYKRTRPCDAPVVIEDLDVTWDAGSGTDIPEGRPTDLDPRGRGVISLGVDQLRRRSGSDPPTSGDRGPPCLQLW